MSNKFGGRVMSSSSSSESSFGNKFNESETIVSAIAGSSGVNRRSRADKSPTSSSLNGETEEGYNSQEEIHVPDTTLTTFIENDEEDNDSSLAQEEEDEKTCWVCFATEADEPSAKWTHPCRCHGTTKWVHQACIHRWIDEKQKGNAAAQVECPQCGTAYLIRLPAAGWFLAILETSDKLVQRMCPFIVGGVCVGSMYWTCITFGAVTIMQAVGHDEGLMLMERADPLLLLVSLPLVPVGLVLGTMVRWEDAVIQFLRKNVPRSVIFRNVLPIFAEPTERPATLPSTLPPLSDHLSVTRTLCGALLLPTVSSFLGKALYDQIPSQLQKTILGGLTFVIAKGVLKIYYKQHSYVRQCKREVLDFTESN